MNEDMIGYGSLIDNALRGVVREVMRQIHKNGLPGDHHCYISFSTRHPGVDIGSDLLKKYPEEMTIVLQHQFWNMEVHDDYFSVVLSFNKSRQKLVIPFAALTAYADPSIKFGLQFKLPLDDEDPESFMDPAEMPKKQTKREKTEDSTAQIISLDSFRKK
jgi:hypothetical protein